MQNQVVRTALLSVAAFVATGSMAASTIPVENSQNNYLKLESAEFLDGAHCDAIKKGKAKLSSDSVLSFVLDKSSNKGIEIVKKKTSDKKAVVSCSLRVKITSKRNVKIDMQRLQLVGRAKIAQGHILNITSSVKYPNKKYAAGSYRTYLSNDDRIMFEMRPLLIGLRHPTGGAACSDSITLDADVSFSVTESTADDRGSTIRLRSPREIRPLHSAVEFWFSPEAC